MLDDGEWAVGDGAFVVSCVVSIGGFWFFEL